MQSVSIVSGLLLGAALIVPIGLWGDDVQPTATSSETEGNATSKSDVDSSADPAKTVVGKWRLRIEKSTFLPGPAPKAETRVYESKGGELKVTVTTVAHDGLSTTVNISGNYDGKDYPITGSSSYDAINLKKINSFVTEGTYMHAGNVVATTHRELSKDGRTMTMTFKTAGEPTINNKAVYERDE